MSAKFTPGQWIFDGNHNVLISTSDFENKEAELWVHQYDDLSEMKANANLIAAAPDMYVALKSIENDDNSIPAAIWEMRNRAIAKAEGVEP